MSQRRPDRVVSVFSRQPVNTVIMHTIDLDQILKYPSASSHSVAYEVEQSNSFGCELLR